MGLENRGEGPAGGISQFSSTAEKQYPTLIPQCTIASGEGQAVSGSRFAPLPVVRCQSFARRMLWPVS